MTAPDPPAEAPWTDGQFRRAIRAWVDAGMPGVATRAQFLAEVDAALRDQPRYLAWVRSTNRWDDDRNAAISGHEAADYLRDTLTPEETP